MKATINHVAAVPGLSIQSVITREGSGGVPPQEKTLAAALAGSLTTRADNDTGDITLAEGHGLEVGDKVDVYWGTSKGSGLRYYANVSAVIGAVITIDDHGPGKSGGNNLPAQGTAVFVSKRTVLDAAFDGDKLQLLVAMSTRRGNLEFRDAADALLDQDELAPNEPYQFVAASGMTNNLSGNPVAAVHVSNGDATASAVFKMGGVYQSDT